MRSLVIAACQRSGTAWISTVLSASGHWCGHERWYRMENKRKPPIDKIEASQAALPLLTDEFVVWQVRHPLNVTASMIRKGVLSKPMTSGKWIRENVPAVKQERTEPEQALRYWYEWNQRIRRRSNLMWCVESVSATDIEEALRQSGREPSSTIQQALDLVPPINTTSHEPMTWTNIPDGKAKKDAVRLATEIGYQIDE